MELTNTQGFEERLAGIRRDVASMRDKAVSAKTIQEQSAMQIRNLVSSIIEKIDDAGKKAEAQRRGDAFLNDLTDDGTAELFFRFVEDYMEEREQFAMQEIDRISEKIEEWKSVIGQGA